MQNKHARKKLNNYQLFSVDVVKIMKLAKERIPTLVGLKHSSKQLFNAHACSLIDNGRLQVLDGSNVR